MKYLAFIAVLLFCAGYWICCLAFPRYVDSPTEMVKWWDLRISIYSVIFGICFSVAWYLTKGVTRAVFLVGMVFCGGDIIDRYFFNINSFEFDDLLLYAFAIYYIYTEYAREIKTNS